MTFISTAMLMLCLLVWLPATAAVTMGLPAGAAMREIALGEAKMHLYVPVEDIETQDKEVAAILGIDTKRVSAQRDALASFDNAIGQKLWPSSIACARMLSQPSSFVPIKGLDIVELGCGLGAVGISAALAGARSVLLTDFQPASLELARASAEANGVSDRVQTCLLDWTDPGSTLQERAVDLVIGSDVLYSRELSASLMDVVAALLVQAPRVRGRSEPRALFVDPPFRPARQVLPQLCVERGLYWGGEVPMTEAEAGTVAINILRG